MSHGDPEMVSAMEVQIGDLLGRLSGRRGEPMVWHPVISFYALGTSVHFLAEVAPGRSEWVRRSRFGRVRARLAPRG